MPDELVISLRVFGPGHGESILLIIGPDSQNRRVFIVDCYSTLPYESPEKNPIIGIQAGVFDWNQVTAVCLTHAHEDHFLGLHPVASMTKNAKWVWSSGIPIDHVVKHYKFLEKLLRSPDSKQKSRMLISETIGDLAEWSKSQEPFQALSGRNLPDDSISIRFIAPKDRASQEYAGRLIDSFTDMLSETSQARRSNFHNIPSAGMVLDTREGVRVILLGDMVQESWANIFDDRDLMNILNERKADILKLPHHCSKYAISEELLRIICDPTKTKAVFTPFRLKTPPPHDEAVKLVSDFVAELWCTISLPREGEVWSKKFDDDPEINLVLDEFFQNPQQGLLPPVECMVAFNVDSMGNVSSVPGKFAHRIK